MGRTKEDFMAEQPPMDEREHAARCTPVLGSLEPWQARQLRLRIVRLLCEQEADSLAFSDTASRILKALQEPLEPV